MRPSDLVHHCVYSAQPDDSPTRLENIASFLALEWAREELSEVEYSNFCMYNHNSDDHQDLLTEVVDLVGALTLALIARRVSPNALRLALADRITSVYGQTHGHATGVLNLISDRCERKNRSIGDFDAGAIRHIVKSDGCP